MIKKEKDFKANGNGKKPAFLKKEAGLSPEDAKLKELLRRAVNSESAPIHLRLAISKMIRS